MHNIVRDKHVKGVTDGLQPQRNRVDSYLTAICNPSDMLRAQSRAVMPPDSAGTTSTRDTVERLHEQLKDALQTLVTSEDWQRALTVAARFHTYSFANTQLIWSQSMARGFTPTRVAGYRAWQKLNRHVRRGERGLAILAPLTRKVDTEQGEEERRLFGFKAVHVFDISQTDGEPLPEIRPALVEGDLPTEWGVVTSLIADAGFSLQVTESDRLGEANGLTDYETRQVVVRASLPGAQRFKTAVHELAHIRLHEPTTQGRPNCRGVVEVEAESVAFMVCASLGVDSTGYSLPYVAGWSGGDIDKVASTADRVMRCAHGVLDALEAARRPRLAKDLEPAGSNGVTISLAEQGASHMSSSAASVDIPSSSGRGSQAEQALCLATSIYQTQLQEPAGAEGRAYLHQRGFDADTIDRWRVGYAPASWDRLVRALQDASFPDDVILESGIAGLSRTGQLYDRMRGRIIFPVFDAGGSPRGFAGRLVVGDGPKYLNTPETALYVKRTLLYGLHLAVPAIAENRRAVIVEGYTDAIAAHQVGIHNAVATGGTALTREQLASLRPVASIIILAFDGDDAGSLAAHRVAQLPRDTIEAIDLRVAGLPAGDDPAGLVAGGQEAWLRELVAGAKPLVDYLIDELVARHNLEEPEAVVRAMRSGGALIDHLTGPHDRGKAVSYLALRLDRGEALVERAMLMGAPGASGLRKSNGERTLR